MPPKRAFKPPVLTVTAVAAVRDILIPVQARDNKKLVSFAKYAPYGELAVDMMLELTCKGRNHRTLYADVSFMGKAKERGCG